jgi:hypothetical protein
LNTADVLITFGWRGMLVGDDGKLRAFTTDDVWDAPRQKARCLVDPSHDAPVESCTCGIYVYFTKMDAFRRAAFVQRRLALVRVAAVPGTHVVLTERGFRAAEVEIRHIVVPERSPLDLVHYGQFATVRTAPAHEFLLEV